MEGTGAKRGEQESMWARLGIWAPLRVRVQEDRPRSCLSACLHVLRQRPGADAFWQPSLGARGPDKLGLVPGLQ